MSFFHIPLTRAADKKRLTEERLNIVNDHISALKKEFSSVRKFHADLKHYAELLQEISYIFEQFKFEEKIPMPQETTVDALLKEAHELADELTQEIKEESKYAHLFN